MALYQKLALPFRYIAFSLFTIGVALSAPFSLVATWLESMNTKIATTKKNSQPGKHKWNAN